MSANYPELIRAQTLITETLKYEEIRFKDLLTNGIKQLDEEISKISNDTLSGKSAFKLYDTYGFPFDLTEDILRSKNIKVNKKEFNESLEKQKSKARQNWSGTGSKATDKIWFDILSNTTPTDFLGYEEESGAAIIQSIVVKDKIVNTISVNDEAVIILNQNTIYGGAGG